MMNSIFAKIVSNKKSNRSPRPSRPPSPSVLLGIPANIAVGPLGFRADLDTDSILDGRNTPSRISFRDDQKEPRDLPAQEASTSGVVVDRPEDGDDLTREDPGDARNEQGEPTEVLGVPDPEPTATVVESAHTPVDTPKEPAGGFGSLKDVLMGIFDICGDDEEVVTVRNRTEDLRARVQAIESLFATPPLGDVAEQRRRSKLIRDFKLIEDQLWAWFKNPEPQRMADLAQDHGEVSGLLEDIREIIFDYQAVRQNEIYGRELKLIDPAEAAVLNHFRSAREAGYCHGDRKGCLKSTRTTVLDEIRSWARDFDNPPVYWLNGLAGTGKTTLAQTTAERLFADGQLGASFFCSRDFEDRSNLHFIFPTLATQLARRYVEFRSIFVPLARADPEIAYESLYNQMDKLIAQPLRRSSISTVIVIDALDECKDEEPASAILSVLGQFVSEIPKVKFFVTGRPESRIQTGFRLPLLAKATNVFVLHEVGSRRVNNDIRLFFQHMFSEIASRRRLPSDWPSEEQLDLLCERAAGLFVYAMATVRFVDHKSKGPKKQLDRLLQSPESSGFEGSAKFKLNTTLDSLYMSILQEAFRDNDPGDDPKVRSVLGAVVLAVHPLSPSSIAILLDFDTEEVLPLLSLVQSLLSLQEDPDRPVRSFHKSFPDFITDSERCVNVRFRVCPADHHSELLIGCLQLMNRSLERNMCGLPDGVVNSDVNDLQERADKHINHALRYACRSWHKHLVDADPSHKPKITSVLHRFLEEKFLFWLEVLSVLGAARESVDALGAAAKWLDASPTLDLVNDYYRFVITFVDVINESAPHIYHSALPLSPQTSIVRKRFKPYARPFARVVQGSQTSWEPIVSNVNDRGGVRALAWSPCSRFVAVAWYSRYGVVEVLDGETLEPLSTLKTTDSPSWLSFSPCGRFLVGLSQRSWFTSWDLQTGGQTGHSYLGIEDGDSPVDVSFTHSMDGGVFVAACELENYFSDTKTWLIFTYNLITRTRAHSHEISDGRIVPSIWTCGDHFRFVTVKPGSITIWQAGFTSIDTLAEVESLPVTNDVCRSGEFLFLPVLSRLAFVLEGTVLVWDAPNSSFLLNFVCEGSPAKMTFSSDGRFFACQVTKEDICIWKDSPTGYVLHQKLVPNVPHTLTPASSFGPPSPVSSTSDTDNESSPSTQDSSLDATPQPIPVPDRDLRPHLSPNGEFITLHNQLTIQLWPTEGPTLSAPNTPAPSCFLLEFSPDKSLAAVAQEDGPMVRVLDLTSGDPRLMVDTGMEVRALQTTGSTVVVVDEGKVVSWNLPPWDHASCVRRNIDDGVQTTLLDQPRFRDPSERKIHASISPDLKRIAFLDNPIFYHAGLVIHDTSTARRLASTPSEHAIKTWFSPDGQDVWSVSKEDLIERRRIVVEDGEFSLLKFESLPRNAQQSAGFPWQSLHGYEVTANGWVHSRNGKPLLWLPRRWRSDKKHYRKWGGRFLGLLYSGLPEPIILEFFPNDLARAGL